MLAKFATMEVKDPIILSISRFYLQFFQSISISGIYFFFTIVMWIIVGRKQLRNSTDTFAINYSCLDFGSTETLRKEIIPIWMYQNRKQRHSFMFFIILDNYRISCCRLFYSQEIDWTVLMLCILLMLMQASNFYQKVLCTRVSTSM